MEIFEIAAIALIVLLSVYGFWLYYRAVGSFPGEPLRPLGHWLRVLVGVFDAFILFMIPPFLAANGCGTFPTSYIIGRLVIPALVPPGYDVDGSLLQRISQTARDFVFDKVFSKVAALIFVVVVPWVMNRLFGEAPLVQNYLVFLATQFPPPPLQVYKQFTSHAFAMSGWFYVALMMYRPRKPVRFRHRRRARARPVIDESIVM
ncbi:hypothetical protein NKH10_32290 [Mesorhizobium sp. M1340]|uniref:hypothetical protein n=1 Tax=unclassified Mesorhizobium TaxID=325217 RepID=UPI00333BE360